MEMLRRRMIEALRDLDDWIYERVVSMRVLFVTTDGYGFACESPVIRALLGYPNVRVGVVHDRNLPTEQVTFNDEDDRELFTGLRLDARTAAFRNWHIVVYSHVCSFYPRRRALRVYLTRRRPRPPAPAGARAALRRSPWATPFRHRG